MPIFEIDETAFIISNRFQLLWGVEKFYKNLIEFLPADGSKYNVIFLFQALCTFCEPFCSIKANSLYDLFMHSCSSSADKLSCLKLIYSQYYVN